MQMRRHSLLEPQPPYVDLPRVAYSRFGLVGRRRKLEPADVFGRLVEKRPLALSLPEQISWAKENVSGLSAGVPFAGEIVQYYVDVPILVALGKINTRHAAVFMYTRAIPISPPQLDLHRDIFD